VANYWLRSCGYNQGIVEKVEKDIFEEDTLVSYKVYRVECSPHVKRQENRRRKRNYLCQQELRDTIVRRHGNRKKTFWCTAQ